MWRPGDQTRGFTLIEVLLVMGLLAALSGLTIINLTRPQTRASLDGIVATLVADLRSQQIKAMAGDSLTAASAQAHGVYVQSGAYTLFKGASYSSSDADNFVVQADAGVALNTTLPSTQVVFTKGSGTFSGFASGQNSITVSNAGESKVITINRYGVVAVN